MFSHLQTPKLLRLGSLSPTASKAPSPWNSVLPVRNWDNIGWNVNVRFSELLNRIRPNLPPF